MGPLHKSPCYRGASQDGTTNDAEAHPTSDAELLLIIRQTCQDDRKERMNA